MTRAKDYDCPECGETLAASAKGSDRGVCVACGWSGLLEEASPTTSSPFDVSGRQPYPAESEGVVSIYREREPDITLSPTQAENFAEALEVAARDARRDRDPDDGVVE